MKKTKKKVKPFVRLVKSDMELPVLEVFWELGYRVYEDPTSDRLDWGYFISNIPLTYGWLRENHKHFNISKKQLKDTVSNLSEDDEELDEHMSA